MRCAALRCVNVVPYKKHSSVRFFVHSADSFPSTCHRIQDFMRAQFQMVCMRALQSAILHEKLIKIQIHASASSTITFQVDRKQTTEAKSYHWIQLDVSTNQHSNILYFDERWMKATSLLFVHLPVYTVSAPSALIFSSSHFCRCRTIWTMKFAIFLYSFFSLFISSLYVFPFISLHPFHAQTQTQTQIYFFCISQAHEQWQ